MSLTRIEHPPAPPERTPDANKGDCGKVLIVAGSRGMSGAAVLCGTAALRGGAGLVFLAVPGGIADVVAAAEPGYLTRRLPEDDAGHLAATGLGWWDAADDELDFDVCAAGPGLGTGDGVREFVRYAYPGHAGPMVCDADVLNALARLSQPENGGPLEAGGPRILTPHPGEFARLLDVDIPTVQADREGHAARYAAEQGVVLLLKGRETVVTDGDRLYVNGTGNAGMATGGTGDVLTGLVAALVGQGMPPFDAACFGAHLHGRAGDLMADRRSARGLIASDMAEGLCAAWVEFEGI